MERLSFRIVILILFTLSNLFNLFADEKLTINKNERYSNQHYINKIIDLEKYIVRQHNLFLLILIIVILGSGVIVFQLVRKRKAFKLLEVKSKLIESQQQRLSDLLNSLSRSEEHFMALRDMISDGLIVLDNEDKIIFLNEKGYELLGLSSSELNNQLFFKFMDAKNENIYFRNLSLIKEGYTKPYEIEIIVKSNNYRLYIIPKAILDNEMNYKGSFNVFRFAEKADFSSGDESIPDMFKVFIKHSNDAVLITNKYGEIIEWNLAAERITGYSRQELLGIRYWDLQSFLKPNELKYANYKEAVKLLFQQAVETGQTPELNKIFDRKIVNAENKNIILQENNFTIDLNGDKLFCSIFRDITNHKKMEEALFKSEKRFRELADTMPQPVFETDRKGKLSFLSASGFEFLDLTLDDFDKGILITDYLSEKDKDKLFSTTKNLLKNVNGKSTFEFTIINKFHQKKDILLFVKPFYTEFKLDGFRGIAIDITERNNEYQLLLEREERYRAVFNTSPNMIGITRVDDQTLVDINDTLCKIRNVKKEQVIGKNTYESGIFQTKEIRDGFWRLLRENGIVTDYKFEHVLDNGEIHFLSVNSNIVKIKDMSYVISSVADITNENNFHNAILDSEIKYRNIFDLSPELIVLLDKQGRVLDINSRVSSLSGYNTDEIIGQSAFELPFINPDTRSQMMTYFKDRNSRIKVDPYIIDFIHKNGEVRKGYIVGTGLPNRTGELDKTLIILTDITDNIKHLEQIKLQKFMLENITNTTPMSIFLIELDSKKVFWANKDILELLDYSYEETKEIWDDGIISILHPDDRNLYDFIIGDFTNYEEDREVEFRLQNKAGVWIWLFLKYVPFKKDENGKITQILGLAYDISERKQLLESIIKSENSLRELNITKDKFFSIISHDLMNPISTFLGISEVLYTSYNEFSHEDIHKFAKAINDSAKKLYQLLENLLQWSRIQIRKIECFPEINNLYDVVDSIINLFELQLKNKQLNVINEIPIDFWCKFDINMINTIFRNFISNSIKFSERDSKVIISSFVEDHHVRISVKDFGIGINTNSLANLFKIDKVQSMPGTENESGTGLGLIICKEFIEMHNGKIWVESKESQGTTFYFTLPLE